MIQVNTKRTARQGIQPTNKQTNGRIGMKQTDLNRTTCKTLCGSCTWWWLYGSRSIDDENLSHNNNDTVTKHLWRRHGGISTSRLLQHSTRSWCCAMLSVRYNPRDAPWAHVASAIARGAVFWLHWCWPVASLICSCVNIWLAVTSR